MDLKFSIKEAREQQKNHGLSELQEKDLIEKQILNLQLKYLEKFGHAPRDLFSDHLQQRDQIVVENDAVVNFADANRFDHQSSLQNIVNEL